MVIIEPSRYWFNFVRQHKTAKRIRELVQERDDARRERDEARAALAAVQRMPTASAAQCDESR